jgi:hypothetical protein
MYGTWVENGSKPNSSPEELVFVSSQGELAGRLHVLQKEKNWNDCWMMLDMILDTISRSKKLLVRADSGGVTAAD